MKRPSPTAMAAPTDLENRPPAPPSAPTSLGTKLGWMLAVAAMLASVFFACRIVSLNTQAKLLRADAELARMEVQSLNQQLEAEQILATRQLADLKAKPAPEPINFVVLTPPQPQPEASAIGFPALIAWRPNSQTGIFFSSQLPPANSDEGYALWIESTVGTVSAGVITVSPGQSTQVEFAASKPVAHATRFFLTREHKNTNAQPTGLVILVGSL